MIDMVIDQPSFLAMTYYDKKEYQWHRFETWASSFTPHCLCLSHDRPYTKRPLVPSIHGSKITHAVWELMCVTCREIRTLKFTTPLLALKWAIGLTMNYLHISVP